MDKWEELKRRIDAELSWNVHYSLEKPVEANAIYRVKQWMLELEERETKTVARPKIPEAPKEGFIFTGVPTFDQKAWEEILAKKGLQGLA